MKDPHNIIVKPHISEKSVALSYGNPNLPTDQVKRSYTFVVAVEANKIEIKAAIEAIYNSGKGKKDAAIVVDRVTTVSVRGKRRRVNTRTPGKKSDWKKAIVTLSAGQMLEDYGV